MNQPFNPLESPTGKPTLSVNLHDGSNEQVSIIVVHHNRPEYLKLIFSLNVFLKDSITRLIFGLLSINLSL